MNALNSEAPAAPGQADAIRALRQHGFAFVAGRVMRALLEGRGALDDWSAFAASWNELPVDTYMADHGRYRRRRHAVFTLDHAGGIRREPHQAHFQTLDYNPLHGGIARWFEPLLPSVADGSSLRSVLTCCAELFGSLLPQVQRWQAEVHQFRIEARSDQPGLPTPEGAHRDGRDYVLVLLITRHNIVQGTTEIFDLQHRALGSFTLTDAFDAALVDDARVFHGVTAVEPLAADQPAYRDVLVVTLRREQV